MSMRVEYQKRIEEQLTAWNARLNAVRAQAAHHVKAELERAQADWKVALARLHELKAATGGSWGTIKTELETACRAVAAALRQLDAVVTCGAPPSPRQETPASTRITERGMAVVVPRGEPPEAV